MKLIKFITYHTTGDGVKHPYTININPNHIMTVRALNDGAEAEIQLVTGLCYLIDESAREVLAEIAEA